MTKIHGAPPPHVYHLISDSEVGQTQSSAPEIFQPNSVGRNHLAQNLAIKNGADANFLRSLIAGKLPSTSATSQSAEAVKVVYIPADKRHKGLSPYDNLPFFANRPKGFPDRYRAVNPKRAAAGDRGESALKFPLKAGENQLYDGAGAPRGEISANEVKLNYAQVKEINGEKYYYAFATKIDHDNRKNTNSIGASGWVKASAIEKGNDPKFSKEDIRRSQPPPVSERYGKHEDYQQYTVSNTNPKDFLGEDGKPKYGYIKNGEFISYKVLPGVPAVDKDNRKTSIAASDYLKRGGDVINLGFNPAGMSNDTFKIDQNNPIVFHRAPKSLKGTTIEIDLYYPKDKNHAGEKSVGKMRFVYGYVETPGENGRTEKRWGWMPRAVLTPKSDAISNNAPPNE